MRLLVRCLLFFLSCAIIESSKFRFDYDYYSNINGWLKFHAIPATWSEASKRCEYEGAVLASPFDLNTKSAMTTHMNLKNKNGCPIFTGVHATFSRGDFFSIDGVPLARMPLDWTINEPDNVNNNENCIIFLNDSTIADVNCSEMFPYMCFMKKPKNFVLTSTPCGTIDKDYELNPKNGNCYKFHGFGKNWTDAFMTCSAEGGYLTIINDDDEATYLKSLRDKNANKVSPKSNKEVLLLGFQDHDQDGIWKTIHGSTIEDAGYAVWHAGQPSGGDQFCGAIYHGDKKLDDFWCNGIAPFICEKSPDSLLD